MEADCPVSENICASDSINAEETSNNNTETEKQIRLSVGDNVKISENDDDRVQNIQNQKQSTSKDDGSNDDDDDDEAIIVESVPNIPIDVDEGSTESTELVAVDEACVEHPTANPTKATELVIINTTNTTSITSADENETIDRCPLDISIKDELAITDVVCPNDVLENDPMGLLEPNDRSEITSSSRSQGDLDEYGDDLSSTSSKTGSSSNNVLEWCKDYPWLLYEEGEDVNGFCLYCDSHLNIKSHSYIKQHGLSLYHKERCDNYLAFREEETRNGLSTALIEIKQEFGTDSRVAALKLKRKTQIEALSNFNWRRWLEECPWLERISSEGTTGRCKYCRIRLNVEFSYLRAKHKESVKHKDSEKSYKEGSNDQNSNPNTNNDISEEREQEVDSASNNSEKWSEFVKDKPNLIICKPCNSRMIKTSYAKHLRSNLHAHNVKNYPKNANKRSNSSVAKSELDDLRIKQWTVYAKQHPWLMADPSDAKFAFCKYCEKRVIYGNSVAKRATHENSSHHKYNAKSFHERQGKGNDDDGESNQDEKTAENEENEGKNDVMNSEEEDGGEEEEDEEVEEEQEDEEDNDDAEENELEEEEANEDEEEEEAEDEEEEASDQETETEENDNFDSKKRIYRFSEEWFNQYPWSKKHKKDSNLIYCIYCKITLSGAYSRSKHQTTALHIAAEAEFLSKQAKKQQTQDKRNEASELYEWAIPLKNNPNMYSCKYCNVTISKKCSKKNHASTKIHQINENIYKTNRRKSTRQEGNSTINLSQTSTVVTQPSAGRVPRYAKVIVKTPSVVTLIKNWQKKFTWLSYKRSEIRSNYGYCKICENSLFIRSLKHVVRHTRSIKHVQSCRAIRKQKVEQDTEPDQEQKQEKEPATKRGGEKGPKDEVHESPISSSENKPKKPTTTTTPATPARDYPKEISYKSTIEDLQKRFSWIEKSSRPKLAFCRYCNSHIPIKVLFLRNHSNSAKHRQAVINFCKTSKKSDKMSTETESPEKANDSNRENDKDAAADDDDDDDGKNDDDVIAVEENTEEILISEQDENWDVKSEPMDEHEELDYLLQRSINSSKTKRNSQRNARNSLNTDEQPSKRIKRSQSFRRLNESNSSLVASLLSTPLTLASCIGPILQQQIQQATNAQLSAVQASAVQTTAAVEPENTYDLFFKSISETMKKLPVDLAAEGKVKVMQIICDLELQALKRQQTPAMCVDSPFNNLSGIIYTPTPTTANVANATSAQTGASNVDVAGAGVGNGVTEQNALFGDTLVTSYFSNTNLSPPTASSRPAYVAPTPPPAAPATPTPTMSTNIDTEIVVSSASPVIGVMDKNGLQTLQLKSTMAKQQQQQQLVKNTTTANVTNVSNNNSGIRCIPFKNLTQTQMSGDVNSKFTRIHVPLATSQSSMQQTNAPTTSTPKGMINFRNIQITKRAAPPTSVPPPSGVTTVTLASANSQHQSTMVNKSPQRTYITNIQPQLQRWGCSVNGASPNTPISSASINNQLSSMKQTSTPITKKFN